MCIYRDLLWVAGNCRRLPDGAIYAPYRHQITVINKLSYVHFLLKHSPYKRESKQFSIAHFIPSSSSLFIYHTSSKIKAFSFSLLYLHFFYGHDSVPRNASFLFSCEILLVLQEPDQISLPQWSHSWLSQDSQSSTIFSSKRVLYTHY